MPRKKLFKNSYPFKFGVAPGQHVAHIIGEGTDSENEKEVELKFGRQILMIDQDGHTLYDETSHVVPSKDFTAGYRDKQDYDPYGKVSTEEMFTNSSERKTAEFFNDLASWAENAYEDEENDKEMLNICIAIKDYVTATSRDSQQNALVVLKERMLSYGKILSKKSKDALKIIEDTEDSDLRDQKRQELSHYHDMVDKLNSLGGKLNTFFNGSLDLSSLPEDELRDLATEKPKEPDDVLFGHMGVWWKSKKQLFPHEPSPNDIKQGAGVEDCFMLASLAKLAESDPDFIRNSMKEMGDGSVVVRFFDTEDNNKPVYIKVNKTVNQTWFGHNTYSSSSLWVQMIEKAYAVFRERYVSTEQRTGMKTIWRGNSCEFMSSFTGKSYLTSYNPVKDTLSRLKSSGKVPDYYVPEFEDYYKALYRHINQRGSVAVIGTIPSLADGLKDDEYRKLGLRSGHAYTINKVFEKEVNGKIKKFVQLRDPYATYTPTYKDGKMVQNSYGIGSAIGGATMVGGLIQGGYEDMGNFNVELTDFIEKFGTFSALDKDLFNDLSNIRKRIYDQNPLSDEELQSRENYDDALRPEIPPRKISVDDMLNNYKLVKGNYVPLDMAPPDLKDVLTEKLKDPNELNNLIQNLTNVKRDLASTDQWFVWTNTKEFNAMRDGLAKAVKLAKAVQSKGEKATLKERKVLANTLEDVKKKAEKYIDNKTDSIEKNRAAGKEPSTRANHRLAAALNIANVCAMEKPLTEWIGKKEEALNMVKNDLKTTLDMIKAGEPIPHGKVSEQLMAKALYALQDIAHKDPELAKRAGIGSNEVNEMKDSFEDSFTDVNIIDVNAPKEVKGEKAVFDDYVTEIPDFVGYRPSKTTKATDTDTTKVADENKKGDVEDRGNLGFTEISIISI